MIAWKEDYTVGLREIDSQHKRISQLLNKLAVAVDARKNHRDLSYILADVLNHFRYHFTSEEVYLEDHPDYDVHHQLHCDFTEKARKDEEQARTEERFDFMETSKLLAAWLKYHILRYDVKYFQDLLEKTVIESID
jgi:hemerythrin